MKKLHSFTLYALIAPAITLGAGSVLAEKPIGLDDDSQQKNTQLNQGTMMNSGPMAKGGQQSGMQPRGYMDAVPTNGTHASNLIGADVKTAKGEDVGSVNDLIIDQKGQVVAIVVSVGGFLGLGEKDVAIGWGDVTRSAISDDNELQIKSTREGLMSAPEFEKAD